MTNLHLDSLCVRNFRAFRNLEIAQLGQVNLITGKNGVGKTGLIEALRLYADAGSPRMLRQLLIERDELYRVESSREAPRRALMDDDMYESCRNLFYGRPDISQQPVIAEIGPNNASSETLSIAFTLLTEEIGDDRVRRYRKSDQVFLREGGAIRNGELAYVEQTPGLTIQFGAIPELTLPLSRILDSRLFAEYRQIPAHLSAIFVSTHGLNTTDINSLWERITATDLEDQVQDALNIVTPDKIEKMNVIGRADRHLGTVVIAKTSTARQPLPLRSLGEGMLRAFDLSLALVNAGNGLLLVDEIDSGLHYSVQREIWQLIFQVAQRLNVQVFATTHNWDSVATFQEVAAANTEIEGVLIRLERRGEVIVPTLFDEHKLAIATRAQIEVR